jgi:polyisoprenoid-binding protein YceI
MERAEAIVTDSTLSANSNRAHFVIDAKRSRFTVQAFAAGILSAMGHNPTIAIRTFSGEVDFNPDALQASGLELTIKAASLSVEDDVSDKDRREMERVMKNDVLEADKFPEIRYEASSSSITKLGGALYSASLSGTLSFHGVTHNQPVPVRITTLGEMLRASGEFALKQSDYQINPVSVAGGALKLKDELKFSFEMVAHRQEPIT